MRHQLVEVFQLLLHIHPQEVELAEVGVALMVHQEVLGAVEPDILLQQEQEIHHQHLQVKETLEVLDMMVVLQLLVVEVVVLLRSVLPGEGVALLLEMEVLELQIIIEMVMSLEQLLESTYSLVAEEAVDLQPLALPGRAVQEVVVLVVMVLVLML